MFFSEEVVVDAPVERTTGRLSSWLATGDGSAAAADAMAAGGRVLARAGFAGLNKTVEVRTTRPWLRNGATVIPLRWCPTGPLADFVPTLVASLEISAIDARQSRVVLTGSYRPPLGHLGELLDKAVLHQAATATIRRWLRGVQAATNDADHPEGDARLSADPKAAPKSGRTRAESLRPPP